MVAGSKVRKSDYEWLRVTTSDHEWHECHECRTSEHEWLRETTRARVTTSESMIRFTQQESSMSFDDRKLQWHSHLFYSYNWVCQRWLGPGRASFKNFRYKGTWSQSTANAKQPWANSLWPLPRMRFIFVKLFAIYILFLIMVYFWFH